MKIRFSFLEFGGAVLAGGFAYATQLVEAHIWSPAYTYYLLMLLVAVDGAVQARVLQRRFRPLHLVVQLVAYTTILAFAHGFAKHEAGLVWLAQVALAPFVIFHLRRLIISLGKLGLVDADVARLLELKISKRAEAEEAKQADAPETAPEPAAPDATIAPTGL